MSQRIKGLVVVDVQNDFVDSAGSLYVKGSEDVIDAINERVADAFNSGDLVVYTQDWHPEITPHFEKDGGIWPVHCVGNTWGAELYPRLEVMQDAELVRKGIDGEDGYSGFSVRNTETGAEHDTQLETLLRSRDVTDLTVVGIATDYCVKETVLDALSRGFKTTVVRSCMRGVDIFPGDSEDAIAKMENSGATVLDA